MKTSGSKNLNGSQSAVVAANQKVHTQLALIYDESEPHFRPENKLKVRNRLEGLAKNLPSRKRMLDIGCGTGFLLNLSHDLFQQVDGIDATQAMLDRVDLSPGNLVVQQALAEDLPFSDGTFDLVTAYSFLDHVADHTAVLAEIARVLKPGGMVYLDLIPNRKFWNAIFEAAETSGSDAGPIVQREIDELVNHAQKLKSRFGIDPEDWSLTEPAKSEGHGFDAIQLVADAHSVGLEASIDYEWFLGQAVVMHNNSNEAADLVDSHLQALLPPSAHLYKYLVLVGTKVFK